MDWKFLTRTAPRPALAAYAVAWLGGVAVLAPPPGWAGDDAPTFSSRSDNSDGSSSMTFGARLPTDWQAKVGVDMRAAPPDSEAYDPDRVLDTGKGATRAETRDLIRLIEGSTFRPRFVDGELAASAPVSVRYHLPP